MANISDFRKLSPNELTARGFSNKSERYFNSKTKEVISKRQYQKRFLTGGISLEKRAKLIGLGKRRPLPSAPEKARAKRREYAKERPLRADTVQRVHQAFSHMEAGDSLRTAASKAGLSAATVRRRGVQLGFLEKDTSTGRYKPASEPYRMMTGPVSDSPGGPVYWETLILDERTASFVGRAWSRPGRYAKEPFRTLTGETLFIPSKRQLDNAERQRRKEGKGDTVVYRRVESLDSGLAEAT